MDHHSVPNVDAHMGNARRVIGALEKDQITGTRGAGAGTDVIEPLGPQAAHIPAGVIDYPGHKAGAVKGRGRGAPAPYIGIAQVFFRLGEHSGEYHNILCKGIPCEIHDGKTYIDKVLAL